MLWLPLLVVAGCAPSPVIVGDPAGPPEPPTRSSEAAAVASWVAGFAALVDSLALTTAAWGADEPETVWLAALQAQAAAHVSRIVAEDPVTGGPTVFPTPEDPATPAAPPTTPEEALTLLTQEVATGTPLAREALVAASTGQERLLYASLTVAVNGSLTPALPPVEGGADPAPFKDQDTPASLAVALGHARALISGLELGLGRLSSSDDLLAAGKERLDAARELRNTLIAGVTDDLPEVDVWQLPNAMSTQEEILAGWAVLETNLLDAFGILVASDAAGAGAWLDAMLGQIAWVHRWGGRLPHWPGWVATA